MKPKNTISKLSTCWKGKGSVAAAHMKLHEAKYRTAARDEPFGRERLVERLRVERLSRIEIRGADSLPALVATSAEKVYSVLFLK